MCACSEIISRQFKIPPSTVAPHPDTQHIFPAGKCSPKLGRQIGSMWPIYEKKKKKKKVGERRESKFSKKSLYASEKLEDLACNELVMNTTHSPHK